MEENKPETPEINDDKGWEEAESQFATERGLDPAQPAEPTKVEPPKPEPAKPETAKLEEPAEAKPEAPKPPENETPEQKAEREQKEAEDAAKPEVKDNPEVRSQRALQREMAEDRKAMMADVREKMFAEAPTELTDSDGDPIRTVADVMKLINPNTKKAFTSEEATVFLFQAKEHFQKEAADRDKKVEEISDLQLTLKDEADNIRQKYGELLEKMPALAVELRDDFAKTLQKDEKTGLIVGAPVSLQRFYELALRPYAEHLSKLEADAEAEAKKKSEAERRQTQSDRSDIYASGRTNVIDKEEDEWAAAAKAHYEK